MAEQVGLSKVQRGLMGLLFGVLLVTALFLGAALRDCPHDLNTIAEAVLIGVTFGVVLTIPSAVVGFVIGYLRFKRSILVASCGLLLLVVVLGVGYALPAESCFPEF